MRLSLAESLELHATASEAFLRSAESVPDARWHQPAAEGKWSPAQLTDHLVRTYDALLQELGGGPGMRIRTRLWQRLLLRVTVKPRLLRGGPFPRGIRAPREIRPAEAGPDKAVGLALFRERAASFVQAVRAAPPGKQLTHPFLGMGPVPEGVLFCARHLQHHNAQFPAGEG
jgi:hypothetical protein